MIFKRMPRLAGILMLAALPSLAMAASTEDENAALRKEVEQLKAQLKAAQAANQSAPAIQPQPAAAVVTNPAVPLANPSPQPPATQNVVEPAPVAAAPIAPVAEKTPAVPPGYKLVPLEKGESTLPFANTGCAIGLFKSLPYSQWNDPDHWGDLRRSMTPAEVEGVLGKEHFNAVNGDITQWQYGRCGQSVRGYVQFEKSRIQFWKTPASF